MKIDLNAKWKFYRQHNADESAVHINQVAWTEVSLPHTPRLEAPPVDDQWRGICWYRHDLKLAEHWRGKRLVLEFGAAMMNAEIFVNGQSLRQHAGGYLPFCVDVTDHINWDGPNVVTVRLDNRDDPAIPPGKPWKDLDFCWYGGLYRGVNLHVLEPLHILLDDAGSSSGIFVTTPKVSTTSAVVRVQSDVVNDCTTVESARIRVALFTQGGQVAAQVESEIRWIPAGESSQLVCELTLHEPLLWSIHAPNLYRVEVELVSGQTIIETRSLRIGVRHIRFDGAGFWLNGKREFLRGTNRHQEYPYLGYALSDEAQYRDALKIKNAGFDYVRLSHYPQSPAFMDACDELGIVVMNGIPGWQFIGDDIFRQRCFDNARRMIRRDRNHPCVVLWEVSLNETPMDEAFIARMHQLAHQEYPGDQCFTAGWKKGYDVFLDARQHGGCRKFSDPDRACIVSEYGDWEYYADNAGFNQTGYSDLKPEERSSRQPRGAGEVRLLQQAANFQEAFNDNLATRAAGDGVWVMFDYARGYAPDLEFSGVMDFFRLPKFGYYFYQSQRDADIQLPGVSSGAMIKIASYWTAESPLQVRVFSNCQEVAFYLNGRLIARQRPDSDRMSTRLPHPPFTFHVPAFESGTLLAVGYIDGIEVVSDRVRTPGQPHALQLHFDVSGRPLVADGSDAIFAYASVVDVHGTVVPCSVPVNFELSGPARLIPSEAVMTEAGIAPILVQSMLESGVINLTARAEGLAPATATLRSQLRKQTVRDAKPHSQAQRVRPQPEAPTI